jgi:hypothetical protein
MNAAGAPATIVSPETATDQPSSSRAAPSQNARGQRLFLHLEQGLDGITSRRDAVAVVANEDGERVQGGAAARS